MDIAFNPPSLGILGGDNSCPGPFELIQPIGQFGGQLNIGDRSGGLAGQRGQQFAVAGFIATRLRAAFDRPQHRGAGTA